MTSILGYQNGLTVCSWEMARRRSRALQTEIVNAWTLGHAAAGLLVGFARVPWWGALLLSVGWEAVEHPLKDQWPDAFPTGQDTTASSAADVAAFMVGWGIARVLL